MPDLSICITTYDRWETCAEALQSVCLQRSVDKEVILVDDCSPTPPPPGVRELMEENDVQYLRHESNLGLAAARNSAVAIASGTYFAFCDDDDRWPEGFADHLLGGVRRAQPGATACFAFSEARRRCCGGLASQTRLTDLMRQGVTPPVSSQLYETDLLERVGGWRAEVRSGVDHDLWISLAEIDPSVVIRWGTTAITSADVDGDRITTDETSRREGIGKALRIWRPEIVRVFGRDFYEHFCGAYEAYLNYRFFRYAVSRRAYLAAARKALRKGVITQLLRRLAHRLTGRCRCGTFSEFQG